MKTTNNHIKLDESSQESFIDSVLKSNKQYLQELKEVLAFDKSIKPSKPLSKTKLLKMIKKVEYKGNIRFKDTSKKHISQAKIFVNILKNIDKALQEHIEESKAYKPVKVPTKEELGL